MMSGLKFFFYDLETFGRDRFRLRQAEFAYCVTDSSLKPVEGMSGSIYCAMPPDLLPDPESVMVTGITPREAAEKGFCESEYVRRIISVFPESDVCFTGYNNVKFDDECMRALFYRNFEDPYLMSSYFRNYSRLDILPLVRSCHALYPETFRCAVKEDGVPSFRLTELTSLNDLNHDHAHEALSDVMATISVAGLIRERRPQFWDLFFRMRSINVRLDEGLCLAVCDLKYLRYAGHAAVVYRVLGRLQHSVVLVSAMHIHALSEFNYQSLHCHLKPHAFPLIPVRS